MDSVKMESVQIKEEFPELEPVPIRVEFSGLASLPIKQECFERQCDCCLMEVSDIKAEHNELEISQTEEPLSVKQEKGLETVCIKQEPLEVEFDHMEPVKEESEDVKPNIPELEPVRLRECSVVLERICVREQGAGEEGSSNSTQGGGKEDGRSHSECSLAGSSPAAKARAGGGEDPDCGKGFTQFGNFKINQQTPTGEKPYHCSDCGKSFSNSEYLKKHQRVHTGEKPYHCTDCGKTFSNSEYLKKHQRTHTGEKPYCCSDCGMSFSLSTNLKKHQRTHTGEKPYCCSDCGMSFSRSDSLVSHQRIHTDTQGVRLASSFSNQIRKGGSRTFLNVSRFLHVCDPLKIIQRQHVLHSIFFLGNINDVKIDPMEFFTHKVGEEIKKKFPEVFEKYDTHLPTRTPFSILLDAVSIILQTVTDIALPSVSSTCYVPQFKFSQIETYFLKLGLDKSYVISAPHSLASPFEVFLPINELADKWRD
ncbi:UNVERIFIED_CONTAM: hypothetical protein FKN15_009148 [Acipenser sinensis]